MAISLHSIYVAGYELKRQRKWDSVGIVLYERETIEANSERSTVSRNGQQRPKIILIFASQSRNALTTDR